MPRVLIAVAIYVTAVSGLLAQAPARRTNQRVNPYQRYAGHIVAKADSAASALAAVNGAAGSAQGDDMEATRVALVAIFGRAQERTSRLAGDFDAIQPPADFERLHAQLVEPLRTLALSLGRSAQLYNVNCEQEQRIGVGCDLAGRRAAASRQAMLELNRAMAATQTYAEARERAVRMLAEHGVTLGSLQTRPEQ